MCLVGSTFQMNLVYRKCEVITIVIAIYHHLRIRGDEYRFLFKLVLQQMNCLLHWLIKQPIDETERKHITALEHGLVVHSAVFERLFG